MSIGEGGDEEDACAPSPFLARTSSRLRVFLVFFSPLWSHAVVLALPLFVYLPSY
jgi:hypothetical protein